MAKKYCTIPTDKLFITLLYRTPPETLAEQKEKEEDETATVAQLVNKHNRHKGTRSGQQKLHKAFTKRRKVGRPKQTNAPNPNAPYPF